MYDEDLVLLAEDNAPVANLPDHVLGTRAAVFQILREQSDDDIAIALEIVSSNTLAHLRPTAKRFEWCSMAHVDDFLFR